MKVKTILLMISLFMGTQLNAQARESVSSGQQFDFFSNTKTYIKNPMELRDPFKKVRTKGTSTKKSFGKFLVNNKYSNIPTISSIPLDKIRIVGVLLGKNRRAIARLANGDGLSKDSFILTEGMKLGLNDAEIKAILPGGIVLVEKIKNIYDQEEYIETIIPVSNET